MKLEIKQAIKVLNEGGIVIFPTDTAFGMGCRIDDENAVKRLFKIRKRPISQATPVLVDSMEMAEKYIGKIPQEVASQLIKPYWPGALTIVLLCRTDKVSSFVRGGGLTLGVRMPKNPVLLEIIKQAGVPILGPSANFHGEKTPYLVNDLNSELTKLVDYVLPGECSDGEISTVIDCSVKPWKILRQGATKIKNQKEEAILIIDTSDKEKTRVGLRINKKEYWIEKKMGKQRSQIILPMIDAVLKKNGLKLKDLQSIEVSTRSNTFTGVRVGIAIANSLSYSLGIPVNKTLEGFVKPVYD